MLKARRSVLIVGNMLSGSVGTRAMSEELSERLAARGWTVLATSTRRAPVSRVLDMLMTCWRRRHEYDVAQVDVFSGLSFCWAEAVCGTLRWLGKPYCLVLHGGLLPEFARRWGWRVRRLLATADAVIAPSAYLRERLAAYCGDIAVIPNAVDVAGYSFRPRRNPRPRLVWLRAFHEIYNPVMAVEALALLAREVPNVHLTMIGPDKGDGTFEKTVAAAHRLKVTGQLEIAGAVPKAEVGKWLDKSDIFINTTNADNTPVSVVEAMVCGLPIVSTEAGGVGYLLEDGRDALLVGMGDAKAMAAAVGRILREPGLSARLSAGAGEQGKKFDWPPVLEQYEAVLCSLREATLPRSVGGVRHETCAGS